MAVENNSKTFRVQLVSTWDCARMVDTCRRASASHEMLLSNHGAERKSLLCFVMLLLK